MALFLVVAVLATAAVLGYAMLSANTLQAEISSNLMHAASAEYTAESGINVGMYYLQWPGSAPTSWTTTSGCKLCVTGVPLNDGTSSNFDLRVTANTTANSFTLVATGWPATGSSFSHTATATVTVNRVKIPGAGVFGGNITLPARTTISNAGISGALAIQAVGTITNSGGTITGPTSAAPLADGSYIAPSATTVNYYGVGMTGGNYLWTDGVTLGTPQLIPSSSLTSTNLPAQLPNNPAGIYYHDGDLSITRSTAITGTLIVRGGQLTIAANTVINPASQFPALICEQNAIINGVNRSLTANGVVFLGTGLGWAGTNTSSVFTVNGALVMPAGASIGSSTNGTCAVNFSATKSNVPLLTTFDQDAVSVQTNSWAQ